MSDVSDALSRVHKTAKDHIVLSENISREDRELLVNKRWLQPIIRGWYLLVRPDVPHGESSPWYGSFWEFIGLYLNHKYGKRYCLSAENSLDLHIRSTRIPKQVIAISEKGNKEPLQLPFNTSLLTYSDSANIPKEFDLLKGVQVMSLPLALCRVSPVYFAKNAIDAEIAFRLVKDPTVFIQTILQHEFKRAANRIVGAYEFLNEMNMAEQIKQELENENFYIQPENPFVEEKPIISSQVESPYTARIYALWGEYRDTIIRLFPEERLIVDKAQYFSQLEKNYVEDAYNSLSIEGYRVDAELIQSVIKNDWNPDENQQDKISRDALAAFGYYKAFQSVKDSISRIFDGASVIEEVEKNLHHWMRSLFQPMVDIGVLKSSDLIGFRRSQVYIRGSRHIPFPREVIYESMNALYHCLRKETSPAVRAILGHFLFVYIHPFMDGNGRTARFLMNVLFASAGLPWTIIRAHQRERYFEALEIASLGEGIESFVRFIKDEMSLM